MDAKPLISIVVPVYNTEQYLNQCLKSIHQQTYENWECLIIDDCSTDSSVEIANKWCKTDSRFTLIKNNVNNGLSAVRNIGIHIANGDYITFLDSDDWIEKKYLEVFVNNTPTADKLLVQDLNTVYKNSTQAATQGYKGETFLLPGDLPMIVQDFRKMQGYAWNKLFCICTIRKNKLIFPVGVANEDEIFYLNYIRFIRNIHFINSSNYNYRQLPSSLSRQPRVHSLLRYIFHYQGFLDYLESMTSENKDSITQYKSRRILSSYNYLLNAAKKEKRIKLSRFFAKLFVITAKNKNLAVSNTILTFENKILFFCIFRKYFYAATIILKAKRLIKSLLVQLLKNQMK